MQTNMKLLLIYGEPEVGKTTTCKRLFNTIRGLDSTVDFYERFSWGDFKSILTLNNSKIAIYSAGNEKQHLKGAIDFGNSWGCEVLVATVNARTHYNEPLDGLVCGEDFDWFTLPKGNTLEEVQLNELKLILCLLKSITETIGIKS